jgi:hypothetical protein
MSNSQLRALHNANYDVNKTLFATKTELNDVKASSVPQASLQVITRDLQGQIDELKRQIQFLSGAVGGYIGAGHTLNTSSIHRR